MCLLIFLVFEFRIVDVCRSRQLYLSNHTIDAGNCNWSIDEENPGKITFEKKLAGIFISIVEKTKYDSAIQQNEKENSSDFFFISGKFATPGFVFFCSI